MKKQNRNIIEYYYIKDNNNYYYFIDNDGNELFSPTRKDSIKFTNKEEALYFKNKLSIKLGIKLFIEKYIINLNNIHNLEDVEEYDL